MHTKNKLQMKVQNRNNFQYVFFTPNHWSVIAQARIMLVNIHTNIQIEMHINIKCKWMHKI